MGFYYVWRRICHKKSIKIVDEMNLDFTYSVIPKWTMQETHIGKVALLLFSHCLCQRPSIHGSLFSQRLQENEAWINL